MQLGSLTTKANTLLVWFWTTGVDKEQYNTLLPNENRNLASCPMSRGPDPPKNRARKFCFEIRSDMYLCQTLRSKNRLLSWNSCVGTPNCQLRTSLHTRPLPTSQSPAIIRYPHNLRCGDLVPYNASPSKKVPHASCGFVLAGCWGRGTDCGWPLRWWSLVLGQYPWASA